MTRASRHLQLLAAALVLAVLATGTVLPAAGAQAATSVASPTAAVPPSTVFVPRPLPAHVDLAPGTIGLCNAGLGQVSVTHTTAQGLGPVDLRCGSPASGYVHIRQLWRESWQKAITGAPARTLWDDFAVFAIRRALSHPERGYPEKHGTTWCYSSTIRVTTASGHVLRVLNPTVTVTSRTRDVLTAAPTTRPNCSIR